jgi:hypothetical protein
MIRARGLIKPEVNADSNTDRLTGQITIAVSISEIACLACSILRVCSRAMSKISVSVVSMMYPMTQLESIS